MSRGRGGSFYRAQSARREAFSGHRRRVRGDRAFRRLIRKLPEAAREEIYQMFLRGGDRILAAQRAQSPSSRVRAALSRRVSKTSLRLRVGLIGRPINRRLYFARILEKGRRAQIVNVTRRMKAGGRPYQMRVRAMAARPYVYSAQTKAIRDSMGGELGTFWDRTLARAGQGISDG